MKYAIYFFIIIILAGVNFGVFPTLSFYGVLPNLLLILLVTVSLSKAKPELSFFVAFIGGLILDFSSGIFFGSFTITFLCLALILELITKNFLVIDIDWKYQIIIFILVLILANLLLYGFSLLAFYLHWVKEKADFTPLKGTLLPFLAYNLLLFYPIKRLVVAFNFLEQKYLNKQDFI